MGEPSDRGLVLLLLRDQRDSGGLLQSRWLTPFDDAEERLDGSQTGVARAHGRALAFDILKEGEDQIGVDLLKSELRWSCRKLVGGEADQQ